MANVSSSNGIEKYPKIRFKSTSGIPFPKWESHTLAEYLLSRVEKQVPTDEAPLMAFTAEGGVEPKGDRYDRSYLVKSDCKLYKRTEFGDFIYSSNNLDVGSMGLNRYGTAVISDVYEIFSIKDTAAPSFIDELIHRPNVLNKVLQFRQGCLYGQYRIYADDFLSVSVLAPSKAEQQRISDFFAALDKKIRLQKKLIEHLKKYKRGVIQAVFDDEKQDLFGEISSAKQVKLSALMDFQNGINADASKYGKGIRYISVSDILKNNFITYDKIIGQVDIDSRALATYSVTYGDVLFQRSSETREDAGRSNVYLDTEKTATFGGFVIRGKKKSDYDPLYLKYALDSFAVRKQIMRCAAGAQHINVSQEDLCGIVVNLPTIDIQKRISKFISNIDLRIAKEEQIASIQVTLKKALLQKLFI